MDALYMKQLQKNIRKLRKARGMSQRDLGRKINVSSKYISGWETRRLRVPIKHLNKLCDELEITPEKLIGVTEEDKKWLDLYLEIIKLEEDVEDAGGV